MTARPQQEPAARRVHSRSRLVFDVRGGRTRLAVSDLGAPLRVMRGFPLDDGRLLVQIISAAPGLFAGDLYELAVEMAPGAQAVVITPAATKIHSMPGGGCAEQRIQAAVADGASLEIYPTLSIPFADSDFRQDVRVTMASDARFGWLDPWSFGRIESGERYRFRRLSTRLAINRDARPLYRDALDLAPSATDVSGWGLLEKATHAFAGVWLGPCREPWEPAAGNPIWGRIGEDAGLYARGLFPNSEAFNQALRQTHTRTTTAWAQAPLTLERYTL